MVKGSSVGAHVLKTIDYIDKLNQLSFTMDHKLGVDLVIQFIPNNFLQFIVNFNMNKIQCTLLGQLNMLKTVEPKGMGNFWPLIPLRKVRGNPKGPFRKDPTPNLLKTVNVDKDKSKSNVRIFTVKNKKGIRRETARHNRDKTKQLGYLALQTVI
ncbi:CCHC-type domain-containing protein [Abeliophyllum distichum]|uniref:CCHC-type domain-containing protein n=1 Tax=Abeliophyllum distichum TaxID=126358 RepID=A0ABD1QJ71_9LAMI